VVAVHAGCAIAIARQAQWNSQKMQSFISGQNTLKCGTILYVWTGWSQKGLTHRQTKIIRRFVGKTGGLNAFWGST
jgi:hypothetical protein